MNNHTGMLAPMLVQMERQIDREIAADNKANGVAFGTQTDTAQTTAIGTENDEDFDSDSEDEGDDEGAILMYGPAPQIVTNDLKSLDEMVSDFNYYSPLCVVVFMLLRKLYKPQQI